MKYALIAIIMLLTQQTNPPEKLTITNNGELILTVSRNEFTTPVLGDVFINDEKYKQLLENLDDKIYREPVNARIDKKGNIVSSKNGNTLDKFTFQQKFQSYYYGQGSETLEVPKLHVYPKVDSELLEKIRTTQIGQYVTYFNVQNKERSHNIALSTDAINNHVVFPGETFSFNKVVGKRTEKKGYLPAPVIVKGELTEGIGGGICQVSSTLYNAVDRAGVKIVKRYSHSKRVPYVPPGRDATVSWYGPDFAFTNTHNQPILIRAKINEGSMIVKIFSSYQVHYKPRKVPKAPNELPREIEIDFGTNDSPIY